MLYAKRNYCNIVRRKVTHKSPHGNVRKCQIINQEETINQRRTHKNVNQENSFERAKLDLFLTRLFLQYESR